MLDLKVKDRDLHRKEIAHVLDGCLTCAEIKAFDQVCQLSD
jgi:hypothetical protein